MKILAVIAVLILAGLAGWSVLDARQALAEIKEEVSDLKAQRDSAFALADSAWLVADSLGEKADSLVGRLEAQEAAAAFRIQGIQAEADSLGNQLLTALDSLNAPDTLSAVVERLLGLNASLAAEYEAHRTLTDSVIPALQAQVAQQSVVMREQRQTIEMGVEIEAFLEAELEKALNPGWLGTLFRDSKQKAGLAVVSFGLGYVLGG